MAKCNPMLAKINKIYTIQDIAETFKRHPRTVINWIKDGLEVCSKKRPMMILGSDLREYLNAKMKKNRKPCGPGELYCVACKIPRVPQGHFAILDVQNELVGTLIGECPKCHHTIYRKVSLARIDQVVGEVNLTRTKG
jgi:hypothetical protein